MLLFVEFISMLISRHSCSTSLLDCSISWRSLVRLICIRAIRTSPALSFNSWVVVKSVVCRWPPKRTRLVNVNCELLLLFLELECELGQDFLSYVSGIIFPLAFEFNWKFSWYPMPGLTNRVKHISYRLEIIIHDTIKSDCFDKVNRMQSSGNSVKRRKRV